MTKYCPKCQDTKSLEDFHKSKNQFNGVSGWCKVCTNHHKRQKRSENPEYKRLVYDRVNAKKYGMTPEQYRLAVNGGCDVCGRTIDKMCIDHDHSCCPGENTCGKCIRGVLCGDCNKAEGLLREPDVAMRLYEYMSRIKEEV